MYKVSRYTNAAFYQMPDNVKGLTLKLLRQCEYLLRLNGPVDDPS